MQRIRLCWLAGTMIGLTASLLAAPPMSSDPGVLQRQLVDAQQYLHDWPNINVYRAANAGVPPPPPGVNRVVFLGDSIVERWRGRDGTFLRQEPYYDRGISGQTTPQMLLRFRSDVIGLRPKVVVILGGTNDLAGKSGEETVQDIEGYLASMAQLGKVNGIRVVLSSVLPVCGNHVTDRPPAQIVEINKWLKGYAARDRFVYLDFYSAMVDPGGLLKRDLTQDCLHPNDAGYALMKPLALQAIDQALAGQ